MGPIGHPGGFDATMVKAALESHRSAEFVEVDITSDGGSTKEAFAIYSALKDHPGYVVTRADKVCASAATIVLAAGNHREAYPGTKLLLHRAEIVPPSRSRWTASLHLRRAESLKRTDAKILDIYAACAPAARELFQREMDTESFLPLGVAKSWGLIHCMAGEARWIAGRPYTYS